MHVLSYYSRWKPRVNILGAEIIFFLGTRRLPEYKQRIAGKSVPFEKFSIHKANKYLEQSNRLFLPGMVSASQSLCSKSNFSAQWQYILKRTVVRIRQIINLNVFEFSREALENKSCKRRPECGLRADVSYFLCFPFPREAKEIGDVCTQAILNGKYNYTATLIGCHLRGKSEAN